MRRASTLLLLFVTLVPLASAQVGVGDRVRLRLRVPGQRPTEGILQEIAANELVIQGPTGVLRRVPTPQLIQLQREDGVKRNLLGGAVIGYFAGGLAAGIVAQVSSKSGDEGGKVSAVGGLAGAALGAILGHQKQTTRWTSMSLNTLRPDLLPGTHIRLSQRGGPTPQLEGDVVSATADSVVIAPGNGPEHRLSRSSIGKIEWPFSRKRSTLPGLGIGAGIGALGGVVLGLAAGEDCSISASWICFERSELVVAGAIGFGILGAGIGAAIGYGKQRTVWESAAPGSNGLRVTPVVSRRGVGLRAKLSF